MTKEELVQVREL